MSSLAEYKTIKATQVHIAAERFYVLLEDGRELGIPYDWYWRLAEATPEQLNNWRLIGGGKGISWGGFGCGFVGAGAFRGKEDLEKGALSQNDTVR